MRRVNIPKRDGYREIYVPNEEEKTALRLLNTQIQLNPDQLKSCHGFMPNRNVVSNAIFHVDTAITVKIDLKDYFDSITPKMLMGKAPLEVVEKCLYNKHKIPLRQAIEIFGHRAQPMTDAEYNDFSPRQGLPTSPSLANLAGMDMDTAIRKWISKNCPTAVYTRYADDLAISIMENDHALAVKVRDAVYSIIRRCGFKPNIRKTRIMHATSGNRRVAGVMLVTKDVNGLFGTISVSREIKRKVRAVKHQLSKVNEVIASWSRTLDDRAFIPTKEMDIRRSVLSHKRVLEQRLRGLEEYCKLKMPVVKTPEQKRFKARIEECKRFAKAFNLLPAKTVNKVIKEEYLGEGVYITNDPVMLYGMSAFTVGWTSCMSVSRSTHDYKKGVAFWQRLAGCSLAYLDSGESMQIHGVKRPRMRERCLVFALRDGTKCFCDIYSSRGHHLELDSKLAIALRGNGYLPANSHLCSGKLVIGNVPKDGKIRLPYFDNSYPEDCKLKDGRSAWRVKI